MRAQRRPGFESDRWYLDAYDRETGVKRTLFTMPDISVGDYALSPEGATIWFTASHQGREDLFSVPASGGTPTRVLQGGSISSARPGAGFVVFSKSTLTAPPDVFRVATDGKDVRALTHENAAWLRDVAFSDPQSLTATTAAGQKIQYWLIKPPDFDASKK